MTPEQVLAHPANRLSESQRASYFEHGYLVLEGFLSAAWRQRLGAAMADLRDRATAPDGPSPDFEFEPAPESGAARLRQVLCAADYHDDIWAYASDPALTGLVADLLGPDVTFREASVAYKPAHGGGGFKWHQDEAFFPHSNRGFLMVLSFLDEVTAAQGPTEVVPGSHRGELYDHYDGDGNWLGVMPDGEVARAPVDRAVDLTGPAGTVVITNCAILHRARHNRSDRDRPTVICGYSAADALCHGAIPYHSRHLWKLVHGEPASHVHSENLRLRMPPDWSAHDRYADSRMDNQLSDSS